MRIAGEELAFKIGYVKRGLHGQLVDTGELDEEDALEAIRRLIDQDDDSVLEFDGDANIALEWLKRAIDESEND